MISQEEASALSPDRLLRFRRYILALHEHAFAKDAESGPAMELPKDRRIARSEVVTALSELVAIVAAQQAEIQDLRAGLAAVRASHIAVFGKQAILEQLTKVERDFEGFEASLELEEEASSSHETASDRRADSGTSVAEAADASAAVQGVAAYVAGLDLGGAVNMSKLDHAVERMKLASKERTRSRLKGRVQIKIAKVTRGRKGE